jgi:FkbM family methyltransferase
MKSILKFLFGKLGYRIVETNYHKNLVHINDVYNFVNYDTIINNTDFYHILKRKIEKEDPICCFDIGANIGQTAKKMSSYFPAATIYCFEPVTQTYKLLAENVKDDQGIKVFNFALGADKSEIEIFLFKNSQWNSLSAPVSERAKKTGGLSQSVAVDTVDNFVKQNNIQKIDILKSDTEGYELEVLKGARDCLQNQMIEYLYLEAGFNEKDTQHTYFPRVIEELEKYGYGFSGLFEKSYTKNDILLYANALFMKQG